MNVRADRIVWRASAIAMLLMGGGPLLSALQTPALTISGVVVTDEEHGRPVARAVITLRNTAGQERTTSSADDGSFLFKGVIAGRYTLAASKPAYLLTPYSISGTTSAGTSLVLSSEDLQGITIRLRRGAVIEGVVTNGSGEPVPGLSIDVQNGGPSGDLRRVAEGETDDRGHYRIFGLPEGHYNVAAELPLLNNYRNRSIERPSQADIDGALRSLSSSSPQPGSATGAALQHSSSMSFASVYYPGVSSADDAAVVDLAAGAERSGVDFVYEPTATVAVSGSIAGGGGDLSGVQLAIQSAGRAAGAATRQGVVAVAGDGTFSIGKLQPGRYRLMARTRSSTPSEALYATAEVDARGGDVGGVSMVLQPGGVLSGEVRFDLSTLAPDNRLTVRLSSLDFARTPLPGTPMNTGREIQVGRDGRFRIEGIAPGRYAVSIDLPSSMTSAGWFAKSAALEERDLLDGDLVVNPGSVADGLIISLSNTPASLVGSLRTSSGVTVAQFALVLFPADSKLWQNPSRRTRLIVPASDGRFHTEGLPGGEYLLAPVSAIEANHPLNDQLFAQLVDRATKLVLRDGQVTSVDLQVGDR